MSKLSVIISSYDNHPVTIAHIKQCMLATRPPDEIIVVNDHGTPDLLDMLDIERKCDIHYAYITDDILWNYTGARNLGFWISTGDYIMIEDNDQIPFPDFYEQALQMFKDRPEMGRICACSRVKVMKEDVLTKPREEWKNMGKHIYHRDTNMVKREVFIKVKGCDERFAGAYAWACTDWRRRLDRAGVVFGNTGRFYTVLEGSTIENPEKGLIRRKSYRNYQFARERDLHIQSPIGVLNYKYEHTKLSKNS